MKTKADVRILKDRVIEVIYSSFDYEPVDAYFTSKYDFSGSMGGCSAVKLCLDNKVFVGRNYDFYCSDTPAYVVRFNAGKYKTLGIGNFPGLLDDWSSSYKLNEDALAVLPYLCCDIISEAGIYIETNIRPHEDNMSCRYTKPGATRRCTQTLMQSMLSQFGSIDEILSHLEDYDWYDLENAGFEQSFLMVDKTGRSVIIEFAENQCRWQEASYNANFYLNSDWYEKQTIGCGEQRVSRELAYLPFVRKEEDIFTMMEKGAYTQFYQKDCDVDFAIPEYYELMAMDKNSVAADPVTAQAKCREILDKHADFTWEDKVAKHAWESTFITVVNISDLYLNVHFSEHYGINFKVEL